MYARQSAPEGRAGGAPRFSGNLKPQVRMVASHDLEVRELATRGPTRAYDARSWNERGWYSQSTMLPS